MLRWFFQFTGTFVSGDNTHCTVTASDFYLPVHTLHRTSSYVVVSLLQGSKCSAQHQASGQILHGLSTRYCSEPTRLLVRYNKHNGSREWQHGLCHGHSIRSAITTSVVFSIPWIVHVASGKPYALIPLASVVGVRRAEGGSLPCWPGRLKGGGLICGQRGACRGHP